MTTNVQIKQFPATSADGKPRFATQKVFIRAGGEIKKGCRPLEPGEVVALEDDEARQLLAHLPYELEITLNPPTRPLYFDNMDQAAMTSQFFNPASAGRAEQAQVAMQEMLEQAQSEEAQAEMARINELQERERKIREKEIELGLVEDPQKFEDELDIALADEPAGDNAMSAADLKAEQARAAEAAAETAGVSVAEVETPAVQVPAAEQPRRRRRRRTAAA